MKLISSVPNEDGLNRIHTIEINDLEIVEIVSLLGIDSIDMDDEDKANTRRIVSDFLKIQGLE